MPDLDYLDKYLQPQAQGADPLAYLDKHLPKPAPSVVSEGLKAPARVVGGIAQELGEAGQYVSGSRVGGGLQQWGEQLQQKNAVDPEFAAAHPIITQAGEAAESVAKMAPYLVGDAALSLVAPPAGAAGAAGLLTRAIAKKAAGKLSTVALPLVAGASTGERSYERAVEQGIPADQALSKSLLPATVATAGMAAMGPLGKVGRGLLPAAKTAEGGVVKSILNPSTLLRDVGGAAIADTPVMMGTNMATAAAQQAVGIKPEKTPGQIATDPKEWLSAALTGSMFGALHAVQRTAQAKALGEALTNPEMNPDSRRKVVNYVAGGLPPESREAWLTQAHAAVAAGEPIALNDALLSRLAPPEVQAPKPEETKATILEAVAQSVETGQAPLDTLQAKASDTALADITAKIEESHAPTASAAERFIKQGATITERGKGIAPEVQAELEAKGFTAVKAPSMEAGKSRQNWEIISHEEAARRAAEQEALLAQQETYLPTEEARSHEDVQEAGGLEAPQGEGRAEQAAGSAGAERPAGEVAASKAEENKLLASAGLSGRAIKKLTTEERDAYLRQARAKLGEAQTEPPVAPLGDGEGRHLSDTEALQRKGDQVALGMKNPDGKWERVALAEKNAKGEWVVDASSAESPEAAARMISALREAGLGVGSKFSTSEGASQVLDLTRVQRAFPGQEVRSTEGGYEVTTKSGASIRVTSTGEIAFDRASAEAAYGRKLAEGEVPVASFEKIGKEGVISLTEQGVGEIDHETFHAAMAMALSRKEIEQVLKKYGSEEAAATAYQRFRDGGTSTGWWAKIKALFQSLKDLVAPDGDSVLRKVASGEVWAQERAGEQVVAKFALAKPKDAVEAATQPVTDKEAQRVLKGMARGFWNHVMPVDRVINLAVSSPEYRPIAKELQDLLKWQTHLDHAAQGFVRDVDVLYNEHVAPVLKTDEDIKTFGKSLYTASLYQMSEAANEWSERQWNKTLKAATGKTLAEARAEVKAAIAALTPEQRTARTKILKHVQMLREAHLEALEDNIRGIFSKEVVDRARALNTAADNAHEVLDGEALHAELARLRAAAGDAAAAVAQPIAQLDATKTLKGDYFPLMRFGDHVVKGTLADGRPFDSRFDTQLEARKELAKLSAEGATLRYDYQDQVAMREEANIPLAFLDKYKSILESRGIEGARADNVMNDLKALWVNTLSQYSFRNHLLQRKSVAGFEEDAHKTFLTYGRKYGQAIANTRYGGKIDQIHREISNKIDVASHEGAKPESIDLMRKLHNQLYQQHTSTDAEKLSAITKAATKTTFLYYLTSPSVLAVQWSQPFMTTIPKMAASHGIGQALKTYSRFARNYISGHYSDAKLDAFEERTGGLGEKTFRVMENIWSLPDTAQAAIATAKAAVDAKLSEAQTRGASPQEMASLRVKLNREVQQTEKQALADQTAQRAGLAKQVDDAYAGLSKADQELLTLNLMARQGLRDLSISHNAFDAMLSTNSMKGAIDKALPGSGKAWNKVMEILAMPMQKSETGSRSAAATAAIELARSKGMSYVDAHAYARDVITDTLFNFSRSNRPDWMKGNAGTVIGQFQLFRFHMMGKVFQLTKDAIGSDYKERLASAQAEYQKNVKALGDAEAKKLLASETAGLTKSRDDARKELAYMTGMGVALAGAAGTPLSMVASNTVTNALWEALKFMFSDPDDPWEPGQAFENALKESVGETAGTAMLKGLPALMGWDISHRVGAAGMADFIQGDPPPGLTGTARANWYAGRILGPSWGMVSDSFRAMESAQNGDIAQAVQQSSPKFVKDFAKMLHTSEAGVQSGGKTIVQPDDISPYQLALMMIGINPTEISLAQETSREVANLSATLSARRSSLLKRFTAAQLEGDLDKRDEVVGEIHEWGMKQPKLKISMQELAGAARKGMRNAQGIEGKREKEVRAQLEAE